MSLRNIAILGVAVVGILGSTVATADAAPQFRRFSPPPQVAPSTANFGNPTFAPRALSQYGFNSNFAARPYQSVPPWANVYNPYPNYIYNSGIYPFSYVPPLTSYYNPYPLYRFTPGLGMWNFYFGNGFNFPY